MMTDIYQTDISLYGRLMNALRSNKGKLPEDFILNDQNCTNGVVFSEGSLDKLFSHQRGDYDPEPYERILEKANEDPVEACQESHAFFSKETVRYVMVQRQLNAWEQEHHDLIQSENVVSFLKRRIRETDHVEELKFLLDTCGELDSYDEELKRMIRNLSQSSEVATFCFPSLAKYPDGNELIFQIAKNVDGQAKAEAIYALNPDDEEKKRWMIYEGRPAFLDWYSTGAVIAGKCDFMSMLDNPDLSMDYRDHIGEITSAFLEEGPAVGLKELPDWEGICRKYIRMVRENPSTYGITNIRHEYACLESEKDRNMPAIDHLIQECEEALHDENVLSFAGNKIAKGENLILSELLSIPYDENTAFEALKKDFHQNYENIRYLKDPDHIKKAFEILFDTVDFSVENTSEDFDHTVELIYTFLDQIRPEIMKENPDESFIRKCNEMMEFGLKHTKYGGLYGNTLYVIEFLQNNGVVFNEKITAYMDDVYRKREEAEKKSEIRRMLRQKQREEERKKREEEKMRS